MRKQRRKLQFTINTSWNYISLSEQSSLERELHEQCIHIIKLIFYNKFRCPLPAHGPLNRSSWSSANERERCRMSISLTSACWKIKKLRIGNLRFLVELFSQALATLWSLDPKKSLGHGYEATIKSCHALNILSSAVSVRCISLL